MNRGRPLQRRTRLQPTKLRPAGRKARLVVKQPADTGPSPQTRQAVIGRDSGQCLRCGQMTGQVHHRWPRGRGGHNATSNLMLLCGSGTTGCHGWAEHNRAAAYALGYLVPTGFDPASVQVWAKYRGWMWLDNTGGWSPAPPLGEVPAAGNRERHQVGERDYDDGYE